MSCRRGRVGIVSIRSGGSGAGSGEELDPIGNYIDCADRFGVVDEVLAGSDASFDTDEVAFVGVLGDVFSEFTKASDRDEVDLLVGVAVDGEREVGSGFVVGVAELGVTDEASGENDDVRVHCWVLSVLRCRGGDRW